MDETYPPGTVRLVDLQCDNNNNIAHSSDGIHCDILLVPAPSEHPDDPLNWSRGRKGLATSCVFVCVVFMYIPVMAMLMWWEVVDIHLRWV